MPENKSKHDGMIRGFYHLSEAWHADADLSSRTDSLVDEVMIGFYHPSGSGGTSGEFAVRWEMLGSKLTPQLQVYDDAWESLTHFSDFLAVLAKHDAGYNKPGISPSDLCELLKRMGMKDLTPREKQ